MNGKLEKRRLNSTSFFQSVPWVALVVALGLTATASAAPVTTLADIDQWVGTGSNESALVIDWNNGNDPLAWGYRYDGAATAEDMFLAVVANDSRLYSKIGTAGAFGLPIYGIGYDRNNDAAFALDDSTTFDGDGISVGGPSDGAVSTDPADDYKEGWFTDGFWGQYEANSSPYDGGAWSSGLGVSSQSLADGSWTGLSFADAFVFSDPSQPQTSTVTNSVPEPATLILALLVAGIAVLGSRCCRRRHEVGSASV